MIGSLGIEAWAGWLLTPISGAATHEIAPPVYWHGRLMVAFWGVVAPIAVIISRYFKVMPGQDFPLEYGRTFWFGNHRRLGNLAIFGTLFAVLVVLTGTGFVGFFHSWHSFFGWLTTFLVVALFIGTQLRGMHGGPTNPFTGAPVPPDQWFGDHFNMTFRRRAFEFTHKFGGWLIVIVAVAASFSGLWHADAPRWMPLTLAIWWVILIAVMIMLQAKGRCVDTYQAIWGTSSEMPGSHVTPIGFGIRRLPPT